MSAIDTAAIELKEMDELAAMKSPVHFLHPLIKLLMTIAYILIVVSFDKYAIYGVLVMIVYPSIIFQLSGVPVRLCFHKLRYVIPLVMAVGLFNPFFDHTPMLRIGSVVITGGVISMLTLMLKGVFCLMASFALMATTSMDALCGALRKLRVPNMIVTLLLLTYRYIAVMIDEVAVMNQAYKLRAPGQKGLHISAWGSFLGQLLLRSMDKAQELYNSMQLRGYNGDFYYATIKKAGAADYITLMAVTAVLLAFRIFPVAEIIGGMFL